MLAVVTSSLSVHIYINTLVFASTQYPFALLTYFLYDRLPERLLDVITLCTFNN